MASVSENNRRIASNTVLLYIRMFVIMLVTLYTSRVVLNALGVEDYGIYNVVGGLVVMMGVFNSSMSVATQRFITYELGRGDSERLNQMFSISMNIYFLYALVFIIVAELFGPWLINTQLTIPVEKLPVAQWLFQFSVISVVISLLCNPYNAVIIAHEKMNVYAYISFLEAFLKLGTAFLITAFPNKSLFYYGLFTMFTSIIVTLSYLIYCTTHYKEARYRYFWSTSTFKQVLSFTGWNMFGAVASMAKGQGLNFLLNIFFNPSVNAARGIAYQINNVASQFFNNFYTAVRPQIVKYYAQNDIEDMLKLLFRSNRMLFFLMLVISLPILIEAPFIIQAWLGQSPEYVIPFTRLIILITAVDAMSQPLMTAVQATGKIKVYQITMGTLLILILPISYLFLKAGHSPVTVFWVSLIISCICYGFRLIIIRRLMPFPSLKYLKDVLLRCIVCAILSSVLPFIVYNKLPDNILGFCLVVLACLFSCAVVIWFIGMHRNERNRIKDMIARRINKAFNKS